MSNDDVLVNLLDRPESRTIRKPEDILGRGKGDSDDADGYDLTNPNLHHGAEDIYRPVQSPEPLRPSPLIDAGASSATASESFYLQVGDSGATTTVIADESANEGWSSSFDVSNHFAPPAAGGTPVLSASTPAGLLSIDVPTGSISGMPTSSDFGNKPIAVPAISRLPPPAAR